MDRGRRADEHGIQRLIEQARDTNPVPIDPTGKRRLVVRSVSAKQRPRKPSR